MYTPLSFRIFPYIVFIKIVNAFNNMIYISEYWQICLNSQSNHLTPFSAIKDHQRFRLKYFCKYAPLVFVHFSLSINVFDNKF